MKSKLFTALTLVLSLWSCALGDLTFNDGGKHAIDYYIGGDVLVDLGAPGMATTFSLVSGSSIHGVLHGYNESHINLIGGEGVSDNLWAHDNTTVNVSQGVVGSMLWALDASQVNFSDGLIGDHLLAWNSSRVTFSGGTIRRFLFADNASQVTVSGGMMGWLEAKETSQVTISGGTISNEIEAGTTPGDASTITFIGSDFSVDGVPVDYGELTTIFGGYWWDEPYRHLNGILASGDALNNDFYVSGNSRIVLAPVPIPGAVLLGAIGLGFAGWLVGRRHA